MLPPASGSRPERDPRAERPTLPQPCAAVLSAMRGLTSEFGMGSGDPPLQGSARGTRSGAPAGATLTAACAGTAACLEQLAIPPSRRRCEELGRSAALA